MGRTNPCSVIHQEQEKEYRHEIIDFSQRIPVKFFVHHLGYSGLHRHNSLEQYTDLTVLWDGDIIGHLTRAEMDIPDAVQKIRCMMVGRDIGEKCCREDFDPSIRRRWHWR